VGWLLRAAGAGAGDRDRQRVADEWAAQEPLLIATLQPVLAKLIDKTEITRIEPLLCSVAEASVIIGRSKRFIADGIARGLFAAKKSDGRALPVVQSLKDYVAALRADRGNPPFTAAARLTRGLQRMVMPFRTRGMHRINIVYAR
jgi:hypothetical protein